MSRKVPEIEVRTSAVFAQSLSSIEKLNWVPDRGSYSLSFTVKPKEGYLPLLFVQDYKGSALVKMDGRPYYSLDGYHDYVPLKIGQHAVEVIFSPYRAFGEKVEINPGTPYRVDVLKDGLELYVYLSLALELVGGTQDAELREDLLNLLTNVLKTAYFEGFTLDQASLASAMLHKNINVGPYTSSIAPETLGYDESRLLSRFTEALKEFRNGLELLRIKYGKRGELAAVAHAHIDTGWLWPFDETRKKVARTLSTILTLMQQYNFVYVQSMALYYEWIEHDYPELMDSIKEMIKRGRWAIAAGWVESDANIISGESFARQFLYSQRYYLRQFGRVADVYWLPDTFGFSGNIPQIAKLGGAQLFATHKVFWNETNKFPYTNFNWVGIDGTSIPAIAFGGGRGGYNSTFGVKEILEQWNTHSEKNKPLLYSYGYGDGGGGPTPEMLIRATAINDFPLLPKVDMDFPPIQENKENWRGEIYLEKHRGTYTSHSLMKYLNSKAEVALREAELWSALAGKKTNFEGMWKLVLKDQFHDVLPGSAIREVYDVAYEELKGVIKTAQEIAEEAKKEIAGNGDFPLLFNSLSWDRQEYVELDFKDPAAQILQNGKSLVKTSVPSVGYSPLQSEKPEGEASIVETSNEIVMSNAYFGLKLSKADGTLIVQDNFVGREAFRGNRFVFYENMPGGADAWDIEESYGVTSFSPVLNDIKINERGPLLASVSLRYSFRDSVIIETIKLYADRRRIDIQVKPVMRNRELLLKIWFDANVNTDKAVCEIPFGNLERPANKNTSREKAMFEVPFLRWVDLSEGDYGLALIAEAKHGIAIEGSSLGLSLSKTPVYPDPLTDAEDVEALIGLYPHVGDWRQANVQRAAYELCNPVSLVHGKRGFKSFLAVDKPTLILESVKRAEDDEGLIFRFYETSNERGKARLKFSDLKPREARSVDLLELNEVKRDVGLEENSVSFTYKNYEIITLKLKRKGLF